MNIDLGQYETWQLWVIAVLGLLVLVAGYRIKKMAFFVIWFLIGYTLMGYLMPTITGFVPQIADNALWGNLLPIGGGLLLAIMGFSIEKVCVSGITFALVMMATVQYFGADVQTLAIGGVVAVIAGGAAVMLMKPATIIATSAAGAYALTLAILVLFPNIDKAVFYWPMLLGATGVGSIIQFITTKHE